MQNTCKIVFMVDLCSKTCKVVLMVDQCAKTCKIEFIVDQCAKTCKKCIHGRPVNRNLLNCIMVDQWAKPVIVFTVDQWAKTYKIVLMIEKCAKACKTVFTVDH